MSYRDPNPLQSRFDGGVPFRDVELLRDDYWPRRYRNGRYREDGEEWDGRSVSPMREIYHAEWTSGIFHPTVAPRPPPTPELELEPEPEPAPQKRRLLRSAFVALLTASAYLVLFLLTTQCLGTLYTLLLSEWHDSLQQLNTWAAAKVEASQTGGKLLPFLQRTWSFLSHTLPPLLRKTYAVTFHLAAILHQFTTTLPRTHQLPELLHGIYNAAIARATQLHHHIRSASGTPACPSAECLRIAERTTRFIASTRELVITATVVLSVLAVLAAANYAQRVLSKLVHGVLRLVLLGKKWSSSTSGMTEVSAITVGEGVRQAVKNMESLRKRAESASLVLEVFSRTVGDYCGVVNEDLRELVVQALEDVVGIGKELGIEEVGVKMTAGAGTAGGTAAGTAGEGVCVVCYDGVADMVVLPCRHLALCVVRVILLFLPS
ncbi:hypothetical protein P167DRAFT_73494 [Morchella conica CCBAS932]|uniref:Uncharacterized protein n=1 Tax=Morchella conica CCBAS932 TaxID=1392247 RepID=A0A3N4KU15_9PEZI|nr:hypothetical protein P167DRAFT_73494 [Morchella conica CCBAS932]